jgi:hypothetical protein
MLREQPSIHPGLDPGEGARQEQEHQMDNTTFDRLTSHFAAAGTRRGVLRYFAATALGVGSLAALHPGETVARRKHKKHKGTGGSGSSKGLRAICTPGQDTCSNGLQCSTPTTRHTCSSTVQGVSNWCCVPQGGSCGECDCCGDYYCEFDDNNQPHCVPNPEG